MKDIKNILIGAALVASSLSFSGFAQDTTTEETEKENFYRRARKDPVDVERINAIFSQLTEKVLGQSNVITDAEIKLDRAFFHPIVGRAEFHGDAELGEWGGMGAKLQLYKYPNPFRLGMVDGARLDLKVNLNNFGELRSRLPFDEIADSCEDVREDLEGEVADQLDPELVLCNVFETVRDSESFAEFQENVDPYLKQVKKLATQVLRDEVGEARRLLTYGYRNQQCKLMGGALCKPHLDLKIGGTAGIAGLSGFIRLSQGEMKLALRLESVSWLNGRIVEDNDINGLDEWLYEGFKEVEETDQEEIDEAAEDIAEFIKDIQESIDEALRGEEETEEET